MSGTPTRPSVPPLAWFAVAMWAGCALAEQASWCLWGGERPLGTVVALVCVVCAATLLGLRIRRVRGVCLLVAVGLVTGATVSGLQAASWLRQARLAADCGARVWTGIVEADPSEGAYGVVLRVRITSGPLAGARVRVGWPESAQVPDLGRVVRFSAIARPVPDDEPWARSMARTGAVATCRAWRAETGPWRSGVAGALFSWRASRLDRMHAVEGPGGDLIEGIVLGDRRRLLGTVTEEDFRILGLTHLVAVSGSHLALACGAVAAVGRALRVSRLPLTIAVLGAGGAYALTTGLPYSALRSVVMLAVGAVAVLGGRRGGGLASLAAAVAVVLAIEPWAVFDIGFQLSVLAVGSLLFFGSLAGEWLAFGLRGPAAAVARVLALTLVAQMASAPVVASAFGMMSLLAPVANAYAGPLVALGLWLGLCGAVVGTVVAGLGDVLFRAAAAVMAATAHVSVWFADLPGAAVTMEGGAYLAAAPMTAAVVCWLVWPLPRRVSHARAVRGCAAALTLLLALGPAPVRRLEVTVLDVGQADAVLVRDGGRTMLVDAGADETAMRRALARAGVRRVDVLVLTHAHDDHTGGVGGLLGTTGIGWVGVPSLDAEAVEGQGDVPSAIEAADRGCRRLAQGDAWQVGSTEVRVLWPPAAVQGDLGTNDTSVVLALRHGDFDAVLTGDAEHAAQEGIAACGWITAIEVLKVPHHGSVNGLSADAAASWRPADALVSVGADNTFGHPSAETLELLQGSGARVWRTDRDGDLTVAVRGGTYRVQCSGRGGRPSVRARMAGEPTSRDADAIASPPLPKDARGSQGHPGPQAGLPHLRRRAVVARARPPPPPGPDRRGRRPRLQLGHLRRGVRERR